MESFLRRNLTQTGGTILSGSSLQKPISSYQKKLPDVCSSFYSIADEPFPQVSGFLDETVGQSFLSHEAGTALNSPACIPPESITEEVLRPRNETTNSDLNCSAPGEHSQVTDESTSTKSLQNDKDITIETSSKADGNCNDSSTCATVSTSSLEKSDFTSMKNSTFDVSQDLKERSDTGINATVDLHNIRERNNTFESVQSQEPKEVSDNRLNSTVDIDVPIIKTESANATIDLVQTHDMRNNTFESVQSQEPKEVSDTGINATVDIPSLDCTHDKINSHSDNSGPSNTTTEQPNEKHEGTIDIQPHEMEVETQGGSLNSTREVKINSPITKNSVETNTNVNVTVEIVEQIDSVSPKASGDIQSSSVITKPGEKTFTKPNTTTELASPDIPILKNTTIEITPSNTEITSQANGGSYLPLGNAETRPNNRETEVVISTTASICSVKAPSDSPRIEVEECPQKTERPGFVDTECIQNTDTGNISRNSIFCLDDTLDMKTSFLVTSTPIVFGKESRFGILRDVKPTPMRKRLSVINSIEAHSNNDLVGSSHHDGTVAAQVAENSNQSQKVSVQSTSSHSTSESANENKPPTKPMLKRQLPQLSKLSHPKTGLPPRPQLSMNSSVAVKPKTVQGPHVQHQPDESSSSSLVVNKKAGQLNKGKNMGTVKNTPSAATVKTSMVSSVSGYNFTTVSKPSGSSIPQMKPLGLQPPTRKRLALKTPQTTRTTLETVQHLSSNKPTGLPGIRTRNSLLPSLGQKHLNNDDLPSAKRKRIAAPNALPTVDGDAVQPAEAAHESDCVNCLHHHKKLERFLQELMKLRSECKNWGPLHEKLEMCIEEMKRI